MLELVTDAALDLVRSDARYGYGLFETLRIQGGNPRRLERHLARMAKGAAFLGLGELPDLEAVQDFLAKHTCVPFTGSGVLRLYALDGKLLVSAMAFKPEPPTNVGIAVAESFFRSSTSPLNRFKTLAYLENRVLAREAQKRGLFEVVALNDLGRLTDGSRTTLFLVDGDLVLTPPVKDGALPGIAREVLLEAELAEETPLTPDDLAKADALFLTNALQGVIPVERVRERSLDPNHPKILAAREILEQ